VPERPPLLAPGELADALLAADSDPDDPVALFADLSEPLPAAVAESTLDLVRRSARVIVGIGDRVHPASRALAETLMFTLVSTPDAHPASVHVSDPAGAAAHVAETVRGHPIATSALVVLAQQVGLLPLWEGLVAESATYSTLLAGTEFAAWRAATPRKAPAPDGDEPVLVSRDGDRLTLELNRPERRNAYGHAVRDALLSALQIAAYDPGVFVELRGRGPAFCSGGDLAEFGTAPDPARAHLIRLRHSAGAVLYGMRDRVTAYVHGACIGAGIELPAFVGRVVAAPDTRIALPEVSMGLVPGAGGTVSMTKRIGRWRMAWLGLTGEIIGAEQALRWGLVDEIGD
jgi:hypothetical protein